MRTRSTHSVYRIACRDAVGRVKEATAWASQGWRPYTDRSHRAASSSPGRQPCGTAPSGCSANASSDISRTSSALPGIWRYSAMVEVARTVATRRIDTAGSPSASASSMAVRTMRPRLSAGPPPASPRPGAARSATTVPTPGTARTRPSPRSTDSALVAVAIATPTPGRSRAWRAAGRPG